MADITMTQVRATTHHYTALIDVEVADLEPTLFLSAILDADGNAAVVPEAITDELNANLDSDGNPSLIDATFVGNTTSIQAVAFKANSFDADALTIQLEITTTGGDETGAISLKLEFLDSASR